MCVKEAYYHRYNKSIILFLRLFERMYIRCWLYNLFIFVVSYFIGKFSIWKAYVVVSKLAMNLILLVLILNHKIFFFLI
jgi:hypothetical protein